MNSILCISTKCGQGGKGVQKAKTNLDVISVWSFGASDAASAVMFISVAQILFLRLQIDAKAAEKIAHFVVVELNHGLSDLSSHRAYYERYSPLIHASLGF